MKINTWMVGIVVAMAVGGVVMAGEEKGKAHVLPEDGKAAVVVLELSGGFAPAGKEPAMVIRGNGAVELNERGGRHMEGKISAEELQAVLRYVLDEQKLATITPADLEMKGPMTVNDGMTTSVEVRADGQTWKASGYALDVAAEQGGAGSGAARLTAVAERLGAVRNRVILGGDEGVKRFLDAANAELKKQYPREPELGAKDLRAAYFTDRPVQAVFRMKVTTGEKTWHSVEAVVRAPEKKAAEGEAEVLRVEVMRGREQGK